jgi:hypothetical protein
MNKSIKINEFNKVARANKKQRIVTNMMVKKPIISIFCGALLFASSASAAILTSDISVFSQAEELTDNSLGAMRGKFVSSGNIMYFGVEMVTQWQTSTGEMITATADLGVDLSRSTPQVLFSPNILVQQGNGGDNSTNYGNSVVSGAGGLDGVNGVVQNIQVAGTSNGITNDIGVSVEMVSTNSTYQTRLVSNESSVTAQTASGSTAKVSIENNAIAVSIAVPQQGQTLQQIRSLALGGGQVLQSVQLGGDRNQIRNMINLNVQMNALSSAMSARTSDILTGLKIILPQSNYF